MQTHQWIIHISYRDNNFWRIFLLVNIKNKTQTRDNLGLVCQLQRFEKSESVSALLKCLLWLPKKKKKIFGEKWGILLLPVKQKISFTCHSNLLYKFLLVFLIRIQILIGSLFDSLLWIWIQIQAIKNQQKWWLGFHFWYTYSATYIAVICWSFLLNQYLPVPAVKKKFKTSQCMNKQPGSGSVL